MLICHVLPAKHSTFGTETRTGMGLNNTRKDWLIVTKIISRTAYLDRRGKVCKRFKNNCPGDDWAKLFMKRHSCSGRLSLRMCET